MRSRHSEQSNSNEHSQQYENCLETQISTKRNQAFLGKYPISVLRQEMFKVSLKHLIRAVSKEAIKDQ